MVDRPYVIFISRGGGQDFPSSNLEHATHGTDGDLLAIKRDFQVGQQKRKEVLLAELRGLRISFP